MATKEQIKAAMLKVVGNPTTGIFVDFADDIAEAIYTLDNPSQKAAVPSVEKRIVEPQETR